MKTTLDIADNILIRVRRVAEEDGVTLRSLAEEGLRRVLEEREKTGPVEIRPVTVTGRGLSPSFRGASWTDLRDAAYEGRGSP